jgi:hypothetical protein
MWKLRSSSPALISSMTSANVSQRPVGLGFGLFSSPNTNAVMSSVGKGYYGVASSTLATMRLVRQMLSLGIVMLMFALFIAQVQIMPANYPLFLVSSKTAFIVFAVLCFAGIFASLPGVNQDSCMLQLSL